MRSCGLLSCGLLSVWPFVRIPFAPRTPLWSFQRLQTSKLDFGDGNREGEWKGLGKETERQWKERKRSYPRKREKWERKWNLGGVCVIGFREIDAPSVGEYVFYVFFRFQKNTTFYVFGMTYQKVVKSDKKSIKFAECL